MRDAMPIDVCQLILELRPDLCKRFGFDKPENRLLFLGWLVTSGLREYLALEKDVGLHQILASPSPNRGLTTLQHVVLLARPDVQAAFPLHNHLPEFLQWFYTYGITEHTLWQWLSPLERFQALAQPEPWGEKIAALADSHRKNHNFTLQTLQHQWGVNLVGYVHGQLGIGEDVRMAARALLAANVPIAMVNFKPGAEIVQNDFSMSEHVVATGDYIFNIFCLTALEHGRFYVERGDQQLAGRYNIGYWPWELSQWPAKWRNLIDLVDEVWVSTQHSFDALEPVVAQMPNPIPMRIMPMAVELGSIAYSNSDRSTVRAHFDLPTSARLFCFSFDLNSSIHRKNPKATVEAFLRAFPLLKWGADQVGLVIKAHRPYRHNRAWEQLKALAAQDPRIHIVETTLARPELLALYHACDCFVSLHRAEGYGRGIAEALQLGLHVITTAYSGNLDYCQAPEFASQVDLVRYQLVRVTKGQYPYAHHQVWADADIEHAAQCMLRFVMRVEMSALNVKSKMSQSTSLRFSPSVIGQQYRYRLEEIMSALQMHQKTLRFM